MTEPEGSVAVAEPAPTDAASQSTANGRGRPRPEETVQRDEAVYAALEQPGTRADLVERTGLTQNQVYLSLWRLNRDKRVERTRDGANHMWSRTAGEATSAPGVTE